MTADSSDKLIRFGSDKFDHAAYAKVAQSARLNEVFMAKSAYDVKMPDIFVELTSESETKEGFLGKPERCDFDTDSGTLVGTYSWKAYIKSGRANLLSLKVDYVLLYGGLEDADEQYARMYFEKIARFTSYPYFRAFFSTCAGLSGLALPPLPSLVDRVD